MTLEKIISGGQTGVDRGALDAALVLGFACGGACPRGRRAEDGRIPDVYPLEETRSTSYVQRTLKNVLASDATVVFTFGPLDGGTRRTVELCIEHQKPYLLIGAEVLSAAAAEASIREFVAKHAVAVLNVAGPRASHAPAAYAYTFEVIGRLLRGSKAAFATAGGDSGGFA